MLCSVLSYELFHVPIHSDVVYPNASAEIFEEAQRHSVTPLLYPALRGCAVLSGNVQDEQLAALRRTALYSAQRFEAVLRCQAGLLALLQGIPCAVLKGMSIACTYPHAELRVPGDIDILVQEADIERVGRILSANGYTYTHETDLHTCFVKSLPDGMTIDIEMHVAVSLFPDTEKGIFTSTFMSDALHHTKMQEINGLLFPALSGVYQLIALLSHMERHLMVLGIGLRQMCDWAAAVHAQRGEIGQDDLDTLKRCGLLQFAKVCTRLCEKYLGLPELSWSGGVSEDEVDALFRDVMESGDFHAQCSVRPLISNMTDGYDVDDKGSSFLRSYLTCIRRRVREDYPWTVKQRGTHNAADTNGSDAGSCGSGHGGGIAANVQVNVFWVGVFAVFYPVRYVFGMLRGKRKKVDVHQAVAEARSRERMLRGLEIYK